MDPLTPEDAADASFIDAIRMHGRWQHPCESLEDGGVLITTGPNARSLTFRNSVVRTDPGVAADEVLARSDAFFGSRERGYSLVVRAARDADLERAMRARGIDAAVDAPCMLARAPLDAPALPPGVHVERMSAPQHVADFVEVSVDAYAQLKLPAEDTRLFFSRPVEVLGPATIGFVAYRDGRPAAAALTLVHREAAGIYWVGTAAHAQRLGLGEACTRLATNAGFEAGARVVTLQASPFGEALYRRLGYVTYDRVRQFRQRAPAAAA